MPKFAFSISRGAAEKLQRSTHDDVLVFDPDSNHKIALVSVFRSLPVQELLDLVGVDDVIYQAPAVTGVSGYERLRRYLQEQANGD